MRRFAAKLRTLRERQGHHTQNQVNECNGDLTTTGGNGDFPTIYCREERRLRRHIPSKSYNPVFSDSLRLSRIFSRLSSPQISPVWSEQKTWKSHTPFTRLSAGYATTKYSISGGLSRLSQCSSKLYFFSEGDAKPARRKSSSLHAKPCPGLSFRNPFSTSSIRLM